MTSPAGAPRDGAPAVQCRGLIAARETLAPVLIDRLRPASTVGAPRGPEVNAFLEQETPGDSVGQAVLFAEGPDALAAPISPGDDLPHAYSLLAYETIRRASLHAISLCARPESYHYG